MKRFTETEEYFNTVEEEELTPKEKIFLQLAACALGIVLYLTACFVWQWHRLVVDKGDIQHDSTGLHQSTPENEN